LYLSQDLLETYKGQGKLHRRYAFQILLDILQYFTSQPTLVDVTIPHGTPITLKQLSQYKKQTMVLSDPALTKLTIPVPSNFCQDWDITPKAVSSFVYPHHFGKLDPDLDPHQSGKQDPDQTESGETVEALEGHFGTLEGPNLGKSEWYHIER
jgi:hypothetical protein